MMIADQTIIGQIPNRNVSLKIHGIFSTPRTIPVDFLKTMRQQKALRAEMIIFYNQVPVESNQELIKILSSRLTDKIFLKHFQTLMQEYAKKDTPVKPDPIMEELLQASENSLTRVWDNKYDDEWD